MTGSKILRAGAFASGCMLAIAIFCIALAMPARSATSKQNPPLQKSESFGGYTVNTYFDPDSNSKDAYYEILRNKKSVYRGRATEMGEKFLIGKLYDDDPDAKLVTMGRDITGDGQPDVLISEWTGGANCCLIFHLFEIGPRFRKIADIDAEYGDQGPHFVHLDQAPGLQVQVHDWTFANWHSDFADSPAPRVILRYKHGTYAMAPGLMCTPVVDWKKVAGKVQKVRDQTQGLAGSWPDADIPPLLWGTMLDLIYTCHRIQSYLVLDSAWPKKIGGKEKFFDDLVAQLKKSPYWDTVSQLGT
jgi:hypothetical protein